MSLRKYRPVLALVGVTVSLGMLLGSASEAVFAKESSDPGSFPGRRVGGGSRGDCTANDSLVALSPKTNLSKTTAAYPKLYFSVSSSTKESRRFGFVLKDKAGTTLSRKVFESNQGSGIIGVDLATVTQTPLKVNQTYRWYFSIVCNSRNHAQDIVVDGWIQRVELNPELANLVKKSPDLALVRQYQKAGLWSDALAALVQLRQSNASNQEVSNLWSEMLRAEELEQAINNKVSRINSVL